MPRGPHDDQIKQGDQSDDHARSRRDEFLRKRFPGGKPPAEGEPRGPDEPSGEEDGTGEGSGKK